MKDIVHGTYSAYVKQECRCSECGRANLDYKRAHRERNRDAYNAWRRNITSVREE